jgi:archaeosine-15-forming tRNA-guanine transglycosylase
LKAGRTPVGAKSNQNRSEAGRIRDVFEDGEKVISRVKSKRTVRETIETRSDAGRGKVKPKPKRDEFGTFSKTGKKRSFEVSS